MNYENMQVLIQLIDAMDDAVKKMEKYYEKRDLENFNKSGKIVLDFQEKISKMLQQA